MLPGPSGPGPYTTRYFWSCTSEASGVLAIIFLGRLNGQAPSSTSRKVISFTLGP